MNGHHMFFSHIHMCQADLWRSFPGLFFMHYLSMQELSPILYLFQIPTSTLSRKLQIVLSEIGTPPAIETQRRPGPKVIPYGIPEDQWPVVLARVENHESYRKVADDYGVSRETIRRLICSCQKKGAS
jgi:hypothetical protein